MDEKCKKDYVYFETSPTSPYQIRRIEELNKTPLGNVEAKVLCFYRRKDLPNPLVQLADKHQKRRCSSNSCMQFNVRRQLWWNDARSCLVRALQKHFLVIPCATSNAIS
uniref:CSON013400 protein n=1 Tax=Culicoides sonorensis TaxID=179676 RepID=A0A336MDD8_CULSO